MRASATLLALLVLAAGAAAKRGGPTSRVPPTSAPPPTTAPGPAPTTNPAPAGPIPAALRSPWARPESCAGNGFQVDGFPSTPFRITPFTLPFKNPPKAQVAFSTCDPANPALCMDAYEITVVEKDLDLGLGCGLTTFLAYNGSVPGPTISTRYGRQTMVRFNNQINPNSARYPSHKPCVNGRTGRPFSVHLHGSASLAPYDGWAEDSTCFGESKDYVYPNNRPVTGWYHDHELDITGENAHAGMAGMYLVKNTTDVGVGPDRWGMDSLEEFQLILQDKVLDPKCQLFYDPEGVHKDEHFGDINLVSGTPFPRLAAQPKRVRFRLLSAAVTRPWLLSLVTEGNVEVSSKICKVIAGDGGYRRAPIDFPAGGLFMGVAERYEVVCDLADKLVAGKSIYLWNTFDDRRMKGVAFFCYSHLLMRIDIAATCTPRPGVPDDCTATLQPSEIPTHVDHGVASAELAAATARAKAGVCDRSFKFERSNGHWVINGESWSTVRLAAEVGVNNLEIWCLEAGGGWFHPIHIHLIDMYVLARQDSGSFPQLATFEALVPKDVVALHPGAQVSIMMRVGPHRGDYMFHCHNLRHEDNEMMRSLSVNKPHTANSGEEPGFSAVSRVTYTTPLGTTGTTLYDNYADPRYLDASPKPTNQMPPLAPAYAQQVLARELYRIFYPGSANNTVLCDPAQNPWLVEPALTCRQ